MKPLLIFLIGLLNAISVTAQIPPGWIKQSVSYQIYPSSFQDSDGNGIGDRKEFSPSADVDVPTNIYFHNH